MLSSAALSCFLIAFSDASLYIENVAIEANPTIGNISISFVHDKNGNAIANVTMQSFVTITKLLVYFKITIAEGQKASGFQREVVNIVADVEKIFKGSQVNIIVRAFVDQIKKFMDFKVKFPMPPVRKLFEVLRERNKFLFYRASTALLMFRLTIALVLCFKKPVETSAVASLEKFWEIQRRNFLGG